MAVAFLFAMPTAIQALGARSAALPAEDRERLYNSHMMLQLLCTLAGSVGAAAIFYNKIRLGKEHLTTTHSMWGAGALVLMWLNVLSGLYETYCRRKKASLFWRSSTHRFGGMVALFCGTLAFCYGMSYGWFADSLGQNTAYAIVGLSITGMLIACAGPLRLTDNSGSAGKKLR